MNRPRWFANLPNAITVARLCLVPLIVGLMLDHRWPAAFLLFLAAGLSDAVDGFLARTYRLRSELGAYLDPAADKALLMSIFVALASAGIIPTWLAILVVSRDLMIIGAVLLAKLLDKPVAIRPLLVSKVNTTAQIAFAAATLGGNATGLDLAGVLGPGLWVVAALTLASAGAYFVEWLDHMGG